MFFDRPESGERAVLVHLNLDSESEREDPREFEELVLSAGGDPAAYIMGHRTAPHPRTFIGSGKLEEIRDEVNLQEAEVVMFNHILSPSQERNLEQELECRVLDRTGLILDIFAQRARTHEGKLQVELAQLQHVATRLVRGWTHLERQKGGIGLRGPGETQLETDRRLLRIRIKSITARLEKVRKQRDQGRRSRKRQEIPTVSLVGYTNAGKSTLFNYITDSGVYAADQLFATLDPTLRRLELENVGPVVLADTVGFIAHLPHKLVEAFKATLEETLNADLLLHVIDAASDEREDNIYQVHEVLQEIGADEIPRLEIYNKLDLLEQKPRIDRNADGIPERVWLSAATGDGVSLLLQAVSEVVGQDMVDEQLEIAPDQGGLRAALYRLGAVESENYSDDGVAHLQVRLPRADWNRLMKKGPEPLF
ncbi:MAG: GTPase HflX [Halioglobus sp.]|uniref:GTPase HflX n=1 Tax=uncultured marine bacterium 463 TaxID=257394 RepID=Q6SGT8_9BACT|nr:GTP-binding protein HflX [uncultured marine bacterium 463]MBT7718226.1 GTPase HflX [Halieaceae bacterium]MDG1389532.1 GTPase HflX [Halioglobus sp.]MDG2326437.1 GTPase HflX [Halioglobus sp.]